MTEWRLSEEASQDLLETYLYGAETFGRAAAAVYLKSFYECFERLALNPRMGRIASADPRVRRFEHRRHVVYYEIESTCVRIFAVLHARSVRAIDR